MADYYFFFPNLSIQVGQSPGDIVQSLQTVLAFDPPGPAWRLRTNPCPHAVVLHPSTRCFRLLSIYPNAHSLGRYCSTWNQLATKRLYCIFQLDVFVFCPCALEPDCSVLVFCPCNCTSKRPVDAVLQEIMPFLPTLTSLLI
jgi:hypothetical protein